MTFMDLLRNSFAMARPMPDAEPVMRAVEPAASESEAGIFSSLLGT